MKLQVNASGAWKNVVRFERKQLKEVKLAAGNLGLCAYLAQSEVGLRIVDDADAVELSFTATQGWKPPQRARG
jgi:hypothetical protein